MKSVRPYSKGTRQYLTFVGPNFGRRRMHPVVASESCSFLTTRFPKLVTVDQERALRQQKAAC